MRMTWRHLMRGGLRQIWRYRLRSMLVICCAALGVAGAVTSVNYASGGRQQVLSRIQQLGTNLLVINAEQSRSVGGRSRTGTIVTTLTEADYLALRREVEGIARSSAMVTSGLRIGTPALATRGFGDAEFTEVADIIALALLPGADIEALRARVDALAAAFPLYPDLQQ